MVGTSFRPRCARSEPAKGGPVNEWLRILFYALIAAASPVALTATIAVLKSGHGRINGIIFASAFLIGESLVMGLVLVVGSFTVPDDGSSSAAAVVELLLGAILVLAFWRVRHGEVAPRQRAKSKRTEAVLDRLNRLTALTAFSAGVLLGIGGPKRLTITVIAAGTIAAADVAAKAELGMALLYIVVASVLVWGPVLAYVLAGKRANSLLEDAQGWLTANQRLITMWALLVVGATLMLDASVRLLFDI